MAKLLSKSGVIEVSARNGKAFKIDDEWYSVFKAAQANGAAKGDSVSFEYETVTKGDQQFHNIKGDITVEGRAQKSSGSEERTSAASSAHGDSVGGVSARDQQIIRQNSLTQANSALATFYGTTGTAGEQGQAPEDFAEDVITIARLFEAYSKGEV